MLAISSQMLAVMVGCAMACGGGAPSSPAPLGRGAMAFAGASSSPASFGAESSWRSVKAVLKSARWRSTSASRKLASLAASAPGVLRCCAMRMAKR